MSRVRANMPNMSLTSVSVVCLLLQNGRVSLPELQQVLAAASKEFSHFEEHAKFLEAKNSR